MVKNPTRGNEILDVIFTNSLDLITDVRTQIVPSNMSDHNIVIAGTNLKPPMKQNANPLPLTEIGKFNFEKANYLSIESKITELSLEQGIQNAGMTEEALGVLLKGLVQACTDDNVPIKVPRKPPQVIPQHRKILFRKNSRLNKERKKSLCPHKILVIDKKIAIANTLITSSIDWERQKEEKKAVDRIKVNSKYFFKFAKGRSKIQDSVGQK